MNLLRCFCLVLAASFSTVGEIARAQEPKNILILHMENSRVPGSTLASKVIEQVIGSRPKFQYFDEYLDENRLGTDYRVVAANLERKYVNQKMDLIITLGPKPAQFLFLYGNVVWPSIPKVFGVVDEKLLPGQFPPDVTGVAGIVRFFTDSSVGSTIAT